MHRHSVIRWKVFCETENDWVFGYLEDTVALPSACFNNEAHTINPLRIKQLEKIQQDYTREVSYWKIYCETESDWVFGYSDIYPYPEYCFHNNSHTTSGRPVEIYKIYNNHQKIVEEYIETGGYFQSHSYKLVCTPGVTTHDFTFPYPISALTVKFTTESQHTDDELRMEVAPDTVIGVITTGISEDASLLTVSDTVMDNIALGMYIKITDGVNTDDLGKVIDVNKISNQITTSVQSTNSFSAGAYILISVRVVDNYIIGHPGEYILGEGKIGGSYVPKDTIVRVTYINNGMSTKNFYAILEMLY